jgi:hypothetical protein
MPSQTDQAESNTIRSSRTLTRRDVCRRKPSTPARPPAGAARTNCRDSSDLGNKSREPPPRPRILNGGIPSLRYCGRDLFHKNQYWYSEYNFNVHSSRHSLTLVTFGYQASDVGHGSGPDRSVVGELEGVLDAATASWAPGSMGSQSSGQPLAPSTAGEVLGPTARVVAVGLLPR